MPAGVRLTYGTLNLFSSEITSFSIDREFGIVKQGTVALLEITQPGILSPIELSVSTEIRQLASDKLTAWINKLAEKPLEQLTFLNRVWGNYYLTSVNIKSEEMDEDGDVLGMVMELKFIGNQNFGGQ